PVDMCLQVFNDRVSRAGLVEGPLFGGLSVCTIVFRCVIEVERRLSRGRVLGMGYARFARSLNGSLAAVQACRDLLFVTLSVQLRQPPQHLDTRRLRNGEANSVVLWQV